MNDEVNILDTVDVDAKVIPSTKTIQATYHAIKHSVLSIRHCRTKECPQIATMLAVLQAHRHGFIKIDNVGIAPVITLF